MDVFKTSWYQNKLTAILAMCIGAAFAMASCSHYETSEIYRPLPRQVFLNVYNQPIGPQDLLRDTLHNPQYRKTVKGAETAADFLREALLHMFNYRKSDLVDGVVLREFSRWCSESEFEDLYTNSFVNLGQQRIVMAQDGIVRSRVVGDFNYVGQAIRTYESQAGLKLPSLTYKFEGKILITAHGEKMFPTVYSLTALVQRSLLQDKISGYQIVELELR